MNAKKLTVVLSIHLALLSICSYAQESPFKTGVKIGINLSNASMNTDGVEPMKKQAIPGYVIGLTGEYALSTHFFLSSEVLLLSKGFKLNGIGKWISTGETHWKQTIHMHYLQLPLMATTKFKILNDAPPVLLQAGPYIAYGIAGKTKVENKYVGLSKPNDSEKYSTFGNDGFQRFDCGFTFRLGTEFKRYAIVANLDWGLRNINSNKHKSYDISGRSCKNINGYLTFGYRF